MQSRSKPVTTSAAVVECRNYLNGGCKFGDRCHFLHKSKTSTIPTAILPPKPIVNLSPPKSTVPSSSAKREETKPSPLIPSAEDINDLWGFEKPIHDDGVYFYGAPGVFEPKKQEQNVWQKTGKSFSQVLASNLSEQEKEQLNAENATYCEYYPEEGVPMGEICTFFLAGTCKFGDYCRNIHCYEYYYPTSSEGPQNEINSEMKPSSEANVFNISEISKSLPDERNLHTEPKECGICIEPEAGALYGILSHCDCKFCIECIRGWRKEGLTVAKKADQVRLCPLCRTESYFVIPSQKHLTGTEKEILVDAYKISLSNKPCKVSFFQNLILF